MVLLVKKNVIIDFRNGKSKRHHSKVDNEILKKTKKSSRSLRDYKNLVYTEKSDVLYMKKVF